jgi:hypothetical protein
MSITAQYLGNRGLDVYGSDTGVFDVGHRLFGVQGGDATQLAILQKTFSTREECLVNGSRFGPMVLDFPIVPIEDRMKVICVDTPFAQKHAAPRVPQSVRDALRPIE